MGGAMSNSSSNDGEVAGVRGDRQLLNSLSFSRRSFLTKTSCFGAFYSLAKLISLPALAEDLAIDSRVSPTPIVDKGFASVRKIGNGLYATISDPSKGNTTICNGGVLAGKDGALLVEGFTTPAGGGLPKEPVRIGNPGAVKGARGTPPYFLPSIGESVFRAPNGS